MAMTTSDKIALGQIGIQGVQGLVSGLGDKSQQNATQARLDALKAQQQARDDEFFQMLMNARSNQGNVEQGISSENLSRALGYANAMPLGAEQKLRSGNAMFRGGLEALAGRQLAHGTPNLASGFMDRQGVRDSLSDKSIDDAIQQRRIATAGIDPRAAQQIGGTGGYADSLLQNLLAGQNGQRDFAQQNFNDIGAQRNNILAQNTVDNSVPVEPEKKKTSTWKKIAKVAAIAAPIVAAPFTGGASLALIGAGAGAANAALNGQGAKGIALGAGLGAGTSALGGAMAGSAAKQAVGESAKSAIGRSVLSAQGLGTLSSALAPENGTAQAIRGGAALLPTRNAPAALRGAGFENNSNILGTLPTNYDAGSPPPLQSTPNSYISGLVGAVPQNPANVQSPRGIPQARQAPPFQLPPMTPAINHQVGQVPPVRPNPPDIGRFADAKVGGYGAPMNLTAGNNYAQVAGPAMNAAPAGLLGAAGYAAMGLGAPAAAMASGPAIVGSQRIQPLLQSPMAQRLLGSGQQQIAGGAQRLIGAGQNLLEGARPPAGLLPAVSQTSQEGQQVVAKLMQILKAYNSGSPEDVKASQQIIQMMQPYLARISQ